MRKKKISLRIRNDNLNNLKDNRAEERKGVKQVSRTSL